MAIQEDGNDKHRQDYFLDRRLWIVRMYHYPIVSVVLQNKHLYLANHIHHILQVCRCRRSDDRIWRTKTTEAIETTNNDDGSGVAGPKNDNDTDIQKRVVSSCTLFVL